MPSRGPALVLAQEDLARDAGLRGAELTWAAIALGAVFLLGMLLLVGVLLTRRRR